MKFVKRSMRGTLTERAHDFRWRIININDAARLPLDRSIDKEDVVDFAARLETRLGWHRVENFR